MVKTRKKILNKWKFGNTLSETLIALAIIGIVFTLSIGTFVADYNRNQTVVRLKKIYGVLNQCFTASIAKNGDILGWDFPERLSDEGSYLFFNNYLKNHLVIMRDCKNSTEGSCGYTFKNLQGEEKELSSNWTRFYLNDGMFIALQCNSSSDKYKVIYFYIDTNGKKRLNVLGRDIFVYEYWIENAAHPEYVGKLLPFGHEFDRDELITASNINNCNNTTDGGYCAALIMKDNWQIIKGYPWAQARYVVQ